MANKERLAYSPNQKGVDYVEIMIDAATVVEKGDFICRAEAEDAVTENYGCPPTYLLDKGAEADNQTKGAGTLIGIAMDAKPVTSTDQKIRVATNGIFILDEETASNVSIGDPVEFFADADSCHNQLIVCGTATDQIGTCVATKDDTTTEVLVKLQPSLMNV